MKLSVSARWRRLAFRASRRASARVETSRDGLRTDGKRLAAKTYAVRATHRVQGVRKAFVGSLSQRFFSVSRPTPSPVVWLPRAGHTAGVRDCEMRSNV
ncbi:hypothetical protein AAFF_G00087280 [Aldrovandia affinis]|uniref:Uncharacterized protein n=1 Tax=Aldrovandia affinis TaxID=143900 RepID=A0AAD7WC26_9TELE|nr:hypothetical protein AAFF_G00087280 [Aldrovandia affinis]